MVEKLLENYLIVIAIIIIFGLLFFFLRKVDEKERTKFILTSLAALIFLLFDVFLSPNKDPDYLQRNSPYLDVKLIIEDSDLDGFHYYYLIKNIGQLPAENISFTFLSPMTKGSEIDPINKRFLPPNGGEMKYSPTPIKTEYKQLKQYNSFTLIVSFEAKIKDETKYFVSKYRNVIPSDIQDGIYTYDECTIEEKKLDTKEKLGLIEYEKIEESLARFPGISFNLMLRLNSSQEIREKYIWDIGKNFNSERLSIFLDKNNYLIFRIISEAGDIKSVKVDANSMIGNGIYLNAEVGRKDQKSFIRLGRNGQWVAREEIDFETLFVEDSSFFKWAVLGADISGNNGGFFDVVEMLIYSATLTVPQFAQNKKHFVDKYKQGSKGSVHFDGNDWMYIKDPNNPLKR